MEQRRLIIMKYFTYFIYVEVRANFSPKLSLSGADGPNELTEKCIRSYLSLYAEMVVNTTL